LPGAITEWRDANHMRMVDGLIELKARGAIALNSLITSSGDAAWAQQAPEELVQALAVAGQAVRLECGKRLFSYGEAADGVYLILNGTARAALPGEPGRDLVCLTAGPGSVLGLPSALCAKSYQFDVEALGALEAAYVPVEQMNEILRQQPELCMKVMTMMCDELSTLRQTRDHLSSCTNPGCGLFGACTHASPLH